MGLTIPDPGATEQADPDLADPWAVPALIKLLKPAHPEYGQPGNERRVFAICHDGSCSGGWEVAPPVV